MRCTLNSKQIGAIVVLVVGVGMLVTSHYIRGEVAQGKKEISSAQRKVDAGKSIFSLSPATKEAGKGITGAAQKKINAGKKDAAHYENVASGLKVVGVIVVLLGLAGLFFFRREKGKWF